MISLEANIGNVNPLEASRINSRLLGSLIQRSILAKPAAEADGTFVPSDAASASCSGLIVIQCILARINDKPFPDVTTYDVVKSINVLVVILVVEDECLVVSTRLVHIILLLLGCWLGLDDIQRVEMMRQRGGHGMSLHSFPHTMRASCRAFA